MAEKIRLGNTTWEALDDENTKRIQQWLKREHKIDAPIEMLKQALDIVAKQNPINALDYKMSKEDREKLFKLRKQNKSGR